MYRPALNRADVFDDQLSYFHGSLQTVAKRQSVVQESGSAAGGQAMLGYARDPGLAERCPCNDLCRSSGMGIGFIALTLARPVFPAGTQMREKIAAARIRDS